MKTIKNLTAEELRKSILQLAIQGKLVKQDPNDEPASELVKRIYAEKQKLIKEGKIKKDKNESYIFKGDDNCYYEKIGKNDPVKLEDLPFDIPDNWTWIRFPNLVNFILGKTPERHNPKYWNDGKYPWFSIADMKDKQIIFETKEKISECSLKENFNSFLTPAGTLIMSFKLTVGRVSILGVDAIHNEAIISIFPYLTENNTIRDWLFYTLGLIVEYVDHTDAIKGSTLNKQKMNAMLIPLPPLREQNRIITKLLETKPLIDKYNYTKVKLSVLEQEFPDKLKKSILQYAIEGKLVKQDPNDEPASVLLERIKTEKEKLIKEGKIKRDTHDSDITLTDNKDYYENNVNLTETLPLNIPISWRWVRLNTLFMHNTGKALNSKNTNGELLEYITTSNLYWNTFNLSNLKKMHFSLSEVEKCTVKKGDLLVCEGGDIGRSAIWNFDKIIRIQNHIHRLRPYVNISIEFYLLVFRLYKYIGYIGGKGIGIQGLSSNAIGKLLLPVPPLSEQNKIVNIINNLLNVLKISI